MIAIDPDTAIEFLAGIANHVRAGNFDQAALQAQSVIEAMEEAIRANGRDRELYHGALPLVRQIPELAHRSDRAAVLDSVHEAVTILRTAED